MTKALVDIPSPTGSEKAIGEFILDWYSRHGIKPVRQEIDPNRVNAVGIRQGPRRWRHTHDQRSHGHELYRHRGGSNVLPGARTGQRAKGRGSGRQGLRFGRVQYEVAGLAAFMVAGKAIRESGCTLGGDLILAAVAGAISLLGGPYQLGAYRGEGTGTHHLLSHGIQSDCAIVADRSAHSIVWCTPRRRANQSHHFR